MYFTLRIESSSFTLPFQMDVLILGMKLPPRIPEVLLAAAIR